MLGAIAGPGHAAKDPATATSGLPIPRYVSLKSDHVNVRAGPTKDNDVAWVYTRAGLPVEITADSRTGAGCAIPKAPRAGSITPAVRPPHRRGRTMKSKDELAPLLDRADPASAVAAQLQAGVWRR